MMIVSASLDESSSAETGGAKGNAALGVTEPIAVIYTTETTGNLEPCG